MQSKGGPAPDADLAPPERSRIAAELAALGESAVDAAEQAAVQQELAGRNVQATVQTLMGLAEPLSPMLARPLSEHELARIYRRVAIGLPAGVEPVAAPGIARRSVVTTLAVVAAAAALVLVPVVRGDGATLDTPHRRQQARSETAAMGAAVKAGLDAYGPSGSARARSLADDYAARVQAATAGGRR